MSLPKQEKGADDSVEYVTCKICKSSDTLLGKENRLYFITCESCGSSEFARFLRSFKLTCRTIRFRHQGWLPGSNRKTYQGGLEVFLSPDGLSRYGLTSNAVSIMRAYCVFSSCISLITSYDTTWVVSLTP